MSAKSIREKYFIIGSILFIVGTCNIFTTAINTEKLSVSSGGNPEISCLDTVLIIQSVHAGIGKITAQIKNIGEQPAYNVSWWMSIPTSIPNRWYFEGVIPTVHPQETSLIESTGFLMGFGIYDLTIAAVCESSEKIETRYIILVILFFIFIIR